jgi:membrane protein CcdC involved in cytochrome C biogenesis
MNKTDNLVTSAIIALFSVVAMLLLQYRFYRYRTTISAVTVPFLVMSFYCLSYLYCPFNVALAAPLPPLYFYCGNNCYVLSWLG